MHDLVVEDALAEGLPLARVLDGLVDQPVQAAQRAGGAPQALFLELHHLEGEAQALLADEVTFRHAHVVEEQLRGVAAVHADLVDLLARDAGRVHRHHDQALVLVRRAVAGVGQQAAPVGLHAVGDPHLGAVDHVVVTVAARAGLHRGHVAAAARLADPQAGDHVAGDGGREELAPQLVAAEARQRRCRHVGVHADGHRHAAAVALPQRFGHHHAVAEVQPRAAEFLGVLQPQQAQVAELLEHLVGRELALRLPLRDVRVELLVAEPDDGVFERAVFGGEFHGCLSWCLKGGRCRRCWAAACAARPRS